MALGPSTLHVFKTPSCNQTCTLNSLTNDRPLFRLLDMYLALEITCKREDDLPILCPHPLARQVLLELSSGMVNGHDLNSGDFWVLSLTEGRRLRGVFAVSLTPLIINWQQGLIYPALSSRLAALLVAHRTLFYHDIAHSLLLILSEF